MPRVHLFLTIVFLFIVPDCFNTETVLDYRDKELFLYDVCTYSNILFDSGG